MGENKKIKYKMKIVKYEKRKRYEKEMREAYERYEIYAESYEPHKQAKKDYVKLENAKREMESALFGVKHKKLVRCKDGAYKKYTYNGSGITKAPRFENGRTKYEIENKIENRIENRKHIIIVDENGNIKDMFVGKYITNGIRVAVVKNEKYIMCYDAYGKMHDKNKTYDIREIKEKYGMKIVRKK